MKHYGSYEAAGMSVSVEPANKRCLLPVRVCSVNRYSTTKSPQIKTSVTGDLKLLLLNQHIHQGRPGVRVRVQD